MRYEQLSMRRETRASYGRNGSTGRPSDRQIGVGTFRRARISRERGSPALGSQTTTDCPPTRR